jgi:hypothetical protein
VACQITTDKTSEKVQRTLDKFVEKGFEKQYDRLCILIIGSRQITYKSVAVPAQMKFDCDDDIIGIAELTKHIGTLKTSRLRELAHIIAEELKPTVQADFPARRYALGAALAACAVAPICLLPAAVEPPLARLPLGTGWASLAKVTQSFDGIVSDTRPWENLKMKEEREEMLAFTDRFLHCPIQFVLRAPPSPLTGIRFDLDIKRGKNSRQLIVRDVLVEVVRFRAIAPTFWVGAAPPKKPVVVVEIWNRQQALPWTFRANWFAESTKDSLEEFEGRQILVTRDDWETFLLKLEAKDRGIYEFNIDVILQQDDEQVRTVRVTEKPISVGFFSRPNEADPDFEFLQKRHMERGGIMAQAFGFQ